MSKNGAKSRLKIGVILARKTSLNFALVNYLLTFSEYSMERILDMVCGLGQLHDGTTRLKNEYILIF